MFQLTAILITALVLAQGGGETRGLDELLSVCDVLAVPMKYDGKLIRVRGVWEGAGEGSWIEPGVKCGTPVTAFGYTWPSIISIETADSLQRIHKVEFHTDLRALRAVNDEVQRKQIDPKNNRTWVTFIGVFETRDYQASDIGSDGRGGHRVNGFGHLNGAPGQLLVKTVKDLKIEPK